MNGIPLISTIVPSNPAANIPTHSSEYGIGGWHEVSTILERDNIADTRRRAGMAGFVS